MASREPGGLFSQFLFSPLRKLHIKPLIFFPAIIVIAVLSRRLLGTSWEIIVAPVCVMAFVGMPLWSPIRAAFRSIGKNSGNMWLNHSFFCYYWFRHDFYSLRYAPILLITLIACSYLLSLATNPIVNLINRLVSPLQAKLTRPKTLAS